MSADLSSGNPPFLWGAVKTVVSWLVRWLTPGEATVTALNTKLDPATDHYYLMEDGSRYYPDKWGRTSFPRVYYRSEVRVLRKKDDREITYFVLEVKKRRLILDN